MAYTLACLMMLIISVSFPFMSFSVEGLTQQISLLSTISMLNEFQHPFLALILFLTVILLPFIYISCVFMLYAYASVVEPQPAKRMKPYVRKICKAVFYIEPWLMADVFLIGVLVSLIKISALADIGMGYSFWAFCLYTILVVKSVSLVNKQWIWHRLVKAEPKELVLSGHDHLSNNHVCCHVCGNINHFNATKCTRCFHNLRPFSLKNSLHKAWALLCTAAIFYIPANLYPIMYTTSLGNESPSTIMGGVVLLWKMGSYPIAAIIFIASVFIPLAKMLALSWIYIIAQRTQGSTRTESLTRQRLYRATEFIGRWSMIDIFVVAILVALVQLQDLMSISPGPASISFAIVVIFTMLSAMSFDSRALWSSNKKLDRGS